MQRSDFSDAYTLQQLMPATGWRAVYHDAQGGHRLVAVHMLALASHATRPGWHIVALQYHPGYGWDILGEDDEYCGLLAPDFSLADHEQYICDGKPRACPWPHKRDTCTCLHQRGLYLVRKDEVHTSPAPQEQT